MLSDCPFCDSSNVATREVAGGYVVRCDGCGARGPKKGDDSQARHAWNDRAGAL